MINVHKAFALLYEGSGHNQYDRIIEEYSRFSTALDYPRRSHKIITPTLRSALFVINLLLAMQKTVGEPLFLPGVGTVDIPHGDRFRSIYSFRKDFKKILPRGRGRQTPYLRYLTDKWLFKMYLDGTKSEYVAMHKWKKDRPDIHGYDAADEFGETTVGSDMRRTFRVWTYLWSFVNQYVLSQGATSTWKNAADLDPVLTEPFSLSEKALGEIRDLDRGKHPNAIHSIIIRDINAANLAHPHSIRNFMSHFDLSELLIDTKIVEDVFVLYGYIQQLDKYENAK